jgi:hypothetical protein
MGHFAGVLHYIPAEATYEAIIWALEVRCGDDHLVLAYPFQLDVTAQPTRESLLDFAAAIEQFAYPAFVELLQRFIQKEAAYAFIVGIRDGGVKRPLLVWGNRTLDEALSQALF